MNSKPSSLSQQSSSLSSGFIPHVTVATVIERDGKFLLVEEKASGKTVLNQPAGHLEANETLIEAAVRETLEETGWHIEVTGLLGIDLYTSPNNGVTYHRTTFVGSAVKHDANATLDEGILRALWLSVEEIKNFRSAPRSPLVLKAIEDFQSRGELPLSRVNHYPR